MIPRFHRAVSDSRRQVAWVGLFDHLVGTEQKLVANGEPERLLCAPAQLFSCSFSTASKKEAQLAQSDRC
jgi:hypothetical protein